MWVKVLKYLCNAAVNQLLLIDGVNIFLTDVVYNIINFVEPS